jgi:hypothetical protein
MSQVQLALWRPSWRSSLTCVLAMCLLVLSKDWNQGLARPSRATLAHEPSAVSLGDLEDPHVLRHALSESAASTGRFSRNVILMVTDFEHQHWAHNLLLNLHSLELHHSLVIASAPRVCSSLHKRLFATGVRVGGHCAHSSYLRETSNASIAAGLHRWQIDKGHVFHLWWQRWRYVALAISMRYNVLSLDTDISLRSDPYPLLWRAYQHRQLVVGIESEKPARKNRYIFPAANLGFVYCRARPGGTVQRLFAEVTGRVEGLLLAPSPTLNQENHTAANMLWDQDIFRDVVETLAFALRPPSFRHVLYHAGTSPANLNAQSRTFDWLHEDTSFFPAAAPIRTVWFQLHDPITYAPDETMAGLPMWFFAAYTVNPHGNLWDGGWLRSSSPVVIAHLVFVSNKAFAMRALGLWHYAASLYQGTDSTKPPRVPGLYQGATDTLPSAEGARVFPEDVRALTMRNSGMQLHAGNVVATWAELLRFTLLALSLQRHAVLPFFPCANGHGPPLEVPVKLRGRFHIMPLGNASLCQQDNAPALATTTPAVAQAQAGAVLWWTPGKHRQPPQFDACCTIVPFSSRWVDPNGLRPLKEERMLNERDLAHLLEEAGGEAGGDATQASMPLSELGYTLDQRRLKRRKKKDGARVLHLDLGGAQSMATLTDRDGAARLAAACDQQDAGYCQRLVRVLNDMNR